MKCYDCAKADKTTDAVAICIECGKAVCMEHASSRSVPAFYEQPGGMANVVKRCEYDKFQILCATCLTALKCCEDRSC